MKTCFKCQHELDADEFYSSKANKDGLSSYCKSCNNEIGRWRHLRVKYDITQEEYKALLEKRGGVCAVCKSSCSTNVNLCVDHCHETGDIRGLLCNDCNRGIGLLGTAMTLCSGQLTI